MFYYRPFAVSIIVVTQIICGTFGPHDMRVEAYARVVKQGMDILQSNKSLQQEDNSQHHPSSQVTNQLRGRAIQTSSDLLQQQQQQHRYQYLMKPHSQDNKMLVYPSSYEPSSLQHRNDMASSMNIDQDIRRLKKPFPKPAPRPMKSGYQYSKPTTEKPVTTTKSFPYFLPTIIPEEHALYFNKDYLPPPTVTNVDTDTDDFPIKEMSLAVSKTNIKDVLMKELSKHVQPPDMSLFPPKDDSADDEDQRPDLTLFPPNHQSSYDSPNADVKVPLGTSYIPPASGPVKIYPVYMPKEGNKTDADPTLNAFPPNINVTYEGTKFEVHPGTSYIPPASGIPGQILAQPQGFTARPYLPPKPTEKTTMKPPVEYLPPTLKDINQMSVTEPDIGDLLHAFPPNVNSNYVTVSGKTKNGSPVTSYLPPPSGNVNNADANPSDMDLPPNVSQSFPPNLDVEYLPPEMMNENYIGDSYIPPASGNVNDIKYLPPVSYLPPTSPTTTPEPTMPPNPVTMTQTVKPPVMISYLPPSSAAPPPPPTPPPALLPTPVPQYLPPNTMMPMMMPMMPASMSKPPPSPPLPPGMVWDVPPWNSHDPEIVFKDPHHGHDFDYHDFHHHHHEIITTTAPPPPPAVSPIKKYGHYYILIKLWYIPLIFTIWISFYIAYILLKSLGRHEAYWPNHTSLKKRSIGAGSPLEAISRLFPVEAIGQLSHREITDRVDDLTCKVQSYIDDFMCKYL